MKIVKISGSLAEQMFQYALYLRLRRDGKDVALHASQRCITSIFNLPDAVMATPEQLAPFRVSLTSRIKSVFGKTASNDNIITDNFGEFNGKVLTADADAYCRGTWASPRYFEAVAEDVRKSFILPESRLSVAAANAIGVIGEGETVAMHIHRPTSPENTCTTDYYNWAIANLQTYVPEARIVVFTDSPELVKQRILLPEGSRFVSSASLSELDIMQAMLRASHIVCANTLMSWWAAWLMPNPDKIVIVPQRWSANPDNQPRDLMPIYWTAIPVT
ncbi:MAG: alpha-1,2-fucosyltransferase [Muribaculaceae bacterium]